MSQFRRSALILLILGGLFVPLGDGWTAEGTAGEAQPAAGTAEQITASA